MSGHELIIYHDAPNKRGHRLKYRCTAKGCATRGDITTPKREKAMELFGMVAVPHAALTDDGGAQPGTG